MQMFRRKRSPDGLVERKIIDKNGKATTVRVRPGAIPESIYTHPRPASASTVLKTINNLSPDGWMRMMRDADADVYDRSWRATDEQLHERGLLIDVSELGMRQAGDEIRAAADERIRQSDLLALAPKRVNPADIDILTDTGNIRLDTLHFYVTQDGAAELWDEQTRYDDDSIIMVANEDGSHYIADGKHRVAAALIRQEPVSVKVIQPLSPS